jgi:hypothetical protein
VKSLAGKQLVTWALRFILPEPESRAEDPNDRFVREMKEAKHEIELSRLIFEEVTDFELIDLAVLRLGLAEERYRYLIRQARRSGVTSPAPGRREGA